VPDKQGFVKRAMMKLGSLAVKFAGGISFDSVSAGWYLRNGYPQIYSILTGGMPAWSGEAVSVETALNHSVVWACNRIISESIGYIPAILMRKTGNEKQPAEGHPMHLAMKMAPNDEISAQGFTEMLTSHCLLQGNGFAHIIRRSGTGTAVQLQHLLPQNVFPDREKDGAKRLVYVIKEPGTADKTYTLQPGKPQDILHLRGLGWDGLRGYSVITMGRQSIGSAIAAERNAARFWAYGGRVPYVLKLDKKFQNDQDFEKFRDDWEKVYSEPQRAPILEPWVTYEKVGLSMKDAQALETRLFTVSEICRWFSVSPHLVQDLSHATFSNIENLALQFVVMTLSTWIGRWEQDFWRCVLTPEEKAQGYFLRHNVNALLRGDFKARMDGYASALQNGHMSIDEVRDLEDRNPLPDGAGSHYHIQLNMQSIGDEQPQQNPQPRNAKPPAAGADEEEEEPHKSWWLRRVI
jgi:HK97 family phage portal protein